MFLSLYSSSGLATAFFDPIILCPTFDVLLPLVEFSFEESVISEKITNKVNINPKTANT